MKDFPSKVLFSHACNSKAVDERVAAKVVEDIESLGRKKIILRFDSDKSIKALRKVISDTRIGETLQQDTPTYSSQSNGSTERGVQSVQGQIRVTKIALEQRLQKEVKGNWPVMHWIVEHAGTVLTYFEIGHDGKIAYQRLHGKRASVNTTEFGEQVLYRLPKHRSGKKQPLHTLWRDGTYLGVNRGSGEAIIATTDGNVVKVRTLRRRPKSEVCLLGSWRLAPSHVDGFFC